MSLRTELAAHLDAWPGLERYTVYPFPPDVPAIPALVITAGDPYQVPRNFGSNGPSQIGTVLDLQVVVQRASIETAWEHLDEARRLVSAALARFVSTTGATARWDQFGKPGTFKAADIDVLGGSLSVMAVEPGP